MSANGDYFVHVWFCTICLSLRFYKDEGDSSSIHSGSRTPPHISHHNTWVYWLATFGFMSLWHACMHLYSLSFRMSCVRIHFARWNRTVRTHSTHFEINPLLVCTLRDRLCFHNQSFVIIRTCLGLAAKSLKCRIPTHSLLVGAGRGVCLIVLYCFLIPVTGGISIAFSGSFVGHSLLMCNFRSKHDIFNG